MMVNPAREYAKLQRFQQEFSARTLDHFGRQLARSAGFPDDQRRDEIVRWLDTVDDSVRRQNVQTRYREKELAEKRTESRCRTRPKKCTVVAENSAEGPEDIPNVEYPIPAGSARYASSVDSADESEVLSADESTVERRSDDEVRDERPCADEPAVESNQIFGIKCTVPSIKVRLIAELIDFMICFLVKNVISYFFIVAFKNIFSYDFKYRTVFDQYSMNTSKIIYITPLQMVLELFFLELINRIVVCVYEVYCLHRGFSSSIGGATIGKMVHGLNVIQGDKLYRIRNESDDIIFVTPGSELGWRCAVHRSVLKNLVYIFMFPTHVITADNLNRFKYDVLCGSIVVMLAEPFRYELSELVLIT